MREIYQMYIDGYSTTEIADHLNVMHEQPPIESGRSWYPTSVKCIIRNEKYVGDSLMQKYYTTNHLEHDTTPDKDLVVDQYYKENTHPAIVARDVYEDANLTTRCNKNSHFLKGKVICGDCGKPYVRNSRKNAKGEYKTWDCKGRKGGGDCRNIILKEERLLELIENKIDASDEASCAGIEQILVFRDGRIEIRMRDD